MAPKSVDKTNNAENSQGSERFGLLNCIKFGGEGFDIAVQGGAAALRRSQREVIRATIATVRAAAREAEDIPGDRDHLCGLILGAELLAELAFTLHEELDYQEGR